MRPIHLLAAAAVVLGGSSAASAGLLDGLFGARERCVPPPCGVPEYAPSCCAVQECMPPCAAPAPVCRPAECAVPPVCEEACVQQCEWDARCAEYDPCEVADLLWDLHMGCDPGDREEAAEALGEFDCCCFPEILPALICALSDCDPEVRAAAAEALADLGCATPEVLCSLEAALYDCDAEVREEAEEALEDLGYFEGECGESPCCPTMPCGAAAPVGAPCGAAVGGPVSGQ